MKKQEQHIQDQVGRRIRELRLSRGIRSKDLADIVGISQGQLSKIENGKVSLSVKILDQLCRVFERPISYLFQNQEEIPRVLGTLATVDGPESRGIRELSRQIHRLTQEKISLLPLSPSQLGSAGDQVEKLQQGVIDLFIDELFYYQKFTPDFKMFAAPYIFRNHAHRQAFLSHDHFKNEMLGSLLDHGIRFLNSQWNWFRGIERVLVSNKPIFNPRDVRGRRVRIFESEILDRFWSAFGAHPVVVKWTDVTKALQRGEIDILPTHKTHVYPLEFCRHAKYVTLLGDVEPVLGLAINEAKYKALPPDLQEGLHAACDTSGEYFSTLVRQAEQENEPLNIHNFQAAYLKVDVTPWQNQAQRTLKELRRDGFLSEALCRSLLLTASTE